MCNRRCNRCNRCNRPGTGGRPRCRPGSGNSCCGNRPGQEVRPGTGSRPDSCPINNVGGSPCSNRTPRAWQGSRCDR